MIYCQIVLLYSPISYIRFHIIPLWVIYNTLSYSTIIQSYIIHCHFVLLYSPGDNFPVFVFMGQKPSHKRELFVFEHRNINDNARNSTSNIIILRTSTVWSFLDQLDVMDQCDALIKKLHEYLDICAPIKTTNIPHKFVIRNKWMTKGLLLSSYNLRKLRKEMRNPTIISHKYCDYFTNIGRKCASNIPNAKLPFTYYLSGTYI